jgi:LysM repeat protein
VKFGVTVKAIQKANGMTSTIIHSGTVLVIP